MFKYLIAIFVLTLNFKAFTEEKNGLEERYIETMALTFQEFGKEGSDSIWPFFSLSDQPAVFHFQNGHVYAMGLNSHAPQWEMQLVQHVPVLFSSHYSGSLPPLHPAFPLEGKRAFVISLDLGNDTPYLPLLTFVHERFHIHQFRAFHKEKVVEAELVDYQNADILAWIELEHGALTAFLQANEREEKLQHLKDYAAISHMRRELLHPHSIKWEDHQQKMEGLADYVSVKTFQVLPFIPNFKAEEFLLTMRQHKNGAIVTTQDAMKGRHYFVGAVLGWALDFCGVQNWKSKIEKGDASLQQMLEDALVMKDHEKLERFTRLQEALDWNGIRKQIEQKLEYEKKESEEIVQTFTAQEGVVIRMGTPSGHMSSGGTHKKFQQVNRSKALMEDTSIATSQDQMWTLRFHGIPLIFEEQNGDRMFKLHSKTTLELNGNQISLQEILDGSQKEHHFISVSLKHDYCELASKRAGKICVEENGLSFTFY